MVDKRFSRFLDSLVCPDAGLSREAVTEIARYGSFVASDIRCFPFLPRAMECARSSIDDAAGSGRSFKSGTVFLADTMSKAKGRFARTWHAPPGGVWGCLVCGNDLLPRTRQLLSLTLGISCVETIAAFGGSSVVRWVNDVLIENAKVAGFLVEGYTEKEFAEEFTLLGFGINVNNTSFPDELAGLAISLKQTLGRDIDVPDFTAEFLARLRWNIGLLYFEEAYFLAEGYFSGPDGRNRLLARWVELTDIIGRDVIYGFDVITTPQYEAKVEGIDEHGGLILTLQDGYKKIEYSGEVRCIDS